MQLAVGTATGIGEYATGLAHALETADSVDVVRLDFARFDPWRFDRRVLWDQVLLPCEAARAGVDVLHCLAGTMPLVATVPLVVTVHDVAWLRVQTHARRYARWYFGRYQLARYERARTIFVDSRFSRDEVLACAPRLDPERVVVAYPGVAREFGALDRAPAQPPVALVVGTVEVRKNLEVLIEVAAAIPELRVVSTGPFTPYRERILALARERGVADRFELRGYVSRAELLALYASATLSIVPSRYEGFGYAAAQALCAGMPLVASNAASLPEVVDGSAPLVAPDDRDGWIDATRAVLADRDGAEARARAARERAQTRFRWSAHAATVAAAYAAVTRGRSRA